MTTSPTAISATRRLHAANQVRPLPITVPRLVTGDAGAGLSTDPPAGSRRGATPSSPRTAGCDRDSMLHPVRTNRFPTEQ